MLKVKRVWTDSYDLVIRTRREIYIHLLCLGKNKLIDFKPDNSLEKELKEKAIKTLGYVRGFNVEVEK